MKVAKSPWIIFYIYIAVCCIYSVNQIYQIGYEEGENKGYSLALDTVNKICSKQLKSDTTVSKLVLINPDTTVYILSPKHIR